MTFTVTDSTGQTATGSVLFAIHPRTDRAIGRHSRYSSSWVGGNSSSPSISDDGRFVAFVSYRQILCQASRDTNLSP